jgi:hypothetical protein
MASPPARPKDIDLFAEIDDAGRRCGSPSRCVGHWRSRRWLRVMGTGRRCDTFFASVLLDAGESIKVCRRRRGYSDPGFTLRTYTCLMPNSEQRTRRPIVRLLGHDWVGDGLEMAREAG